MGCRGTSVLFLPHELREQMAEYTAELNTTYPMEDYRCPQQGVYDALPLVRSLVRDCPAVTALARKAAAALQRRLRGARAGELTSRAEAHARMLGLEQEDGALIATAAAAHAAAAAVAPSQKRPRSDSGADDAPPPARRVVAAMAAAGGSSADRPRTAAALTARQRHLLLRLRRRRAAAAAG